MGKNDGIKKYNKIDANKKINSIYDEDGYNIEGYDRDGYDRDGYDRAGWNKKAIHMKTGTKYDPAGYDINGHDAEGYNRDGYKNGRDRDGYSISGKDLRGYDRDGFNEAGWNREGLNRETGTKYDVDGYDIKGRNEVGYDREGYNRLGYDEKGYNRAGWNRDGINKETLTQYDANGYNMYGIDRNGCYSDVSKKDEDIEIVEVWLESKISIQGFAKSKGMSETQFRQKIEDAIKKQPELIERVKQKNKKTQEMVIFRNKVYAYNIVNGELTVDEFSKMRKAGCNYMIMNSLLSPETKKILDLKLIEYISSGKAEVTDYLNMFCQGIYNEETLEQAKDVIISLARKCVKDPELREYLKPMRQAQIDLKAYKKKFDKNDVQKLGYYDEEKEETVMVQVTEELIEYAKMHIKNNQGYMCHHTMYQALMKIIKGEITREQIQKEHEENKKKTEKFPENNDQTGEIIYDDELVQLYDVDAKKETVETDVRDEENLDRTVILQALIKELKEEYRILYEQKKKCVKLKKQFLEQLEVVKSEKLNTMEETERLESLVKRNKKSLDELGELHALEEKIRRSKEELVNKDEKQEETYLDL